MALMPADLGCLGEVGDAELRVGLVAAALLALPAAIDDVVRE
jgi:hypothetical protein